MSFRHRLQSILVKTLGVSNREASEFIRSGRVEVNQKTISENIVVMPEDEIRFNNSIIRDAVKYYYVAFNKPAGIETTLHPEIENNLLTVFDFPHRLFPVGRLDKASEGLLLMTNDGRIMNRVSGGWFDKEKEYLVRTEEELSDDFLQAMREGIRIMNKLTRPATVDAIDRHEFRIILTEGMNRQIRRMCHKWNYHVVSLKRIRIMNVELGDLEPGTSRELSEFEKKVLFQLVGLNT